MSKRSFTRRIRKLPVFILLSLVAILYFVPIYWMTISSFKGDSQIFSNTDLIPKALTLESYVQLFTGGPYSTSHFFRWYANTLIMTAGYVLASLITCTLGGYAFAQYSFRFKNLIFLTILMTQMIPFHLTVIPLFRLINTFRIVDTYVGGFLPIAVSPFGLLFMRQIMKGINKDLMDAARVDGSSEIGVFFRVVLPVVKPGLAAMTIYFSMEYWNNLLWPLIALRSEDKLPLAVGIASLVNQYRPRYGMVMAASTLATIPIIVIFLLMQKQFYEGMGAMATIVEK